MAVDNAAIGLDGGHKKIVGSYNNEEIDCIPVTGYTKALWGRFINSWTVCHYRFSIQFHSLEQITGARVRVGFVLYVSLFKILIETVEERY